MRSTNSDRHAGTKARRHEGKTRCAFAHFRPGFTLIESLIASIVLAIAVVGVAGVLTSASSQTRAMKDDLGAQALARALMEEVAAKPVAAPTSGDQAGWPSNKNRATYDNIADYNGYTDSTDSSATTVATTLGGSTISFGDGGTYTRSVAFEYRATPSGAAAGTGNFGMITVTVSSPNGHTTTLYRLVANTTVVR
jgi:prepilin-type N-terminal cleavage/methylation domain-containing protein